MISKRIPTFIMVPMLVALLVLGQVSAARALFDDKMTIRDENKMGKDFDEIVRSRMAIVGDTYINDYVDSIVQKIVKAKRPMPFRVKSAVIANPILNAFAIPGGYIYIFTGLVQEVTSESQLAGVIAHELAHVSQRHVASRMEKQKKVSLLSTAGMLAGVLLGVAGGSDGAKAGQALMVGSQGAATAAMLNYSQDDEREADHVGLNSLVEAGYNPEGLPDSFSVMMKNRWFDSGSEMPSYLSTHPGMSERITYLKDRIVRMPEIFTERHDDNTMLHKVQVLVRARYSPATTALAYWDDKPKSEYTPYDHIGRGIVLERLKRQSDAREDFEAAIHLDGEDPIITREAGIYFFKTNDTTRAFKYLQKAVILNKRDALALFYLGRLQAQAKDYARAERSMRKVLELVPEDAEVYQHLGMILGESGDNFGGNLNLAYSAVYSGDTKRAHRFRAQAEEAAETDEQKKALEAFDEVLKSRDKPKS